MKTKSKKKRNTHMSMKPLCGIEFKKKFGTAFYKALAKNLTHNGFTYKVGEVNVDPVSFDPSGSCRPGGLYFANIENILKFIGYGPYIGKIEIPDDAKVYIEDEKFKANKLVLSEVIDNEERILEILKKSKERGCLFDGEESFQASVKNGNLKIMKWLYEEGHSWNKWTFHHAARNGNFETLRWLREEGCPWDEMTFEAAARRGDLEIMKWLKEKECPWGEWTFRAAAINGNFEIMKWLKEKECPWDEMTFEEAARSGNLEVLQWLRNQQCPWNKWTFFNAKIAGNPEILKWLQSQGCPGAGVY